jgi:hypothetical protein
MSRLTGVFRKTGNPQEDFGSDRGATAAGIGKILVFLKWFLRQMTEIRIGPK